MTNTDPDLHLHGQLRTDDQLHLALEDLSREAILPQLWFIFLDEDEQVTGPFMPGEGIPTDPTEMADTDDLGELTAAALLSARVGFIAEIVDAASVVLVWERPGSADLPDDTRAWVRAMAEGCRDREIVLRAQFLLHDHGLKALVPDDYL